MACNGAQAFIRIWEAILAAFPSNNSYTHDVKCSIFDEHNERTSRNGVVENYSTEFGRLKLPELLWPFMVTASHILRDRFDSIAAATSEDKASVKVR